MAIMPLIRRSGGAGPTPTAPHPAGGGPKSGSVPPIAVNSGAASAQSSRSADPRVAAPVVQTIGDFGWDYVVDDAITAAATTTQAKVYDLPKASDVVEIFINLNDVIGGALGSTGNAYKTLNLIEIIRKSGGTPVFQIKGTDIPNLFLRFSKHNTAAPAGTSGTSPLNVAALIEGIRLPAARGPYALRLTFDGYQNLGFTGATSGTYNISIAVKYGIAQGLEAHAIFTDIAMPAGFYDLSPVAPVQDQAIHEVIMSNLAADSDLTQLQITVNGIVVEPKLTAAELQAKALQELVGARPTGVYFLLEPTAVAMNRSSHFYVTMAVGSDTVHWLFYWLE